MTHCSGSPGSATPDQTFSLAGATFKMHIEDCFSPGGLTLKGTATEPGGVSWTFSLSDRALPNDDGHTTWLSADGDVGIRDYGYNPTLIVRA